MLSRVTRLACTVSCAALLTACGGEALDTQDQPAIAAWTPSAVRDGNLRIVSFNIRNYPTLPPRDETDAPVTPVSHVLHTDDQALLAVLRKLDFDLMGVQEIVDPALFANAILPALNEATGRHYEAQFSANENGNPQHVGFVFDTDKLHASALTEHPDVDVKGTHRPGLSARFESVALGGADFSAMVLHLASGSSTKRAALRAEQAAIVSSHVAQILGTTGDDDFMILGDLNTAREEQELAGIDTAFAAHAALLRAESANSCSSYWKKKASNPLLRPSLLDHFYTAGMTERDAEVPVVSGAHCKERACERFESTSPASGSTYWNVSDHCPVYFEIQDIDDDADVDAANP